VNGYMDHSLRSMLHCVQKFSSFGGFTVKAISPERAQQLADVHDIEATNLRTLLGRPGGSIKKRIAREDQLSWLETRRIPQEKARAGQLTTVLS